MTDTGDSADCATNCTVFPLATYISRRSATAGIHGTYFCPPDYSTCSSSVNFYYYPVYNSFSNVMINGDRIKFTHEPMIVFDTANAPYYFPEATAFKNVATFESAYGVKIRSAISNGPSLVENGKNVLDPSKLDSKQSTVKSYRGAIGWKGTVVYLLVVRSATVIDAASVIDAMGLDYAMNLDGGGSTALYNAGKYLLGPGRQLPNVILVQTR